MARKKSTWPWLAWAAFILLAAVILAGCDSQSQIPTGPYGGLPPKRFQGDVTTTVSFVSNPAALCVTKGAKSEPEREIFGCTIIRSDGSTHMILLNPCPNKQETLQGYCHEIGHVNTWPGSHGP